MKALSWVSIVVFSLGAATSSFAEVSDEIRQSWQADYARIQMEITQHKADPLSQSGLKSSLPMMDRHACILHSDRDVLDVQLRRLQALCHTLKTMPGLADFREAQDELDRLKLKSASIGLATAVAVANRQSLFMESRALSRRIALLNPLLDFDEIVFNTFEHQIKKNNIMNHDQDVGYSARPGGGIGVIKGFKTNHPTGRNLMEGVNIQNGPYQGLDISTAMGSFNSFDLSFDGKRIVFAWSRRGENPWDTWTPF
ncbi:MAG: hypothetical protein HQ515_16940, partial [Phycisphaeraceae bacterium]|nr:hypothetical protein [Phycisphaeraceae bacterium]